MNFSRVNIYGFGLFNKIGFACDLQIALDTGNKSYLKYFLPEIIYEMDENQRCPE